VLSFVLLIAQIGSPRSSMAMGFYTIYIKLGILHTIWGPYTPPTPPSPFPFGVLIFTAFMARIPDELLAGRPHRRGWHLPDLRVHHHAGEPGTPIVTVSLFAFSCGAWSGLPCSPTPSTAAAHSSRSRSAIYAYIGNNQPAVERESWPPPVRRLGSPRPFCWSIAQRYMSPAGVGPRGAVKD